MSMKMCGMDIVQNGGVNEYIVSYIYSLNKDIVVTLPNISQSVQQIIAG